jgi:hypothetical protein
MKMYLIIYDASFDDEVNETLVSCCVTGFTKWSKVLGKGEKSDPKMDDEVWPGFNCTIMMAVEEADEPDIQKALKLLYERLGAGGIRVYAWQAEKVI